MLGGVEWIVDTVEEAASLDQDRVSVALDPSGLALALADGAGGTSGGRDAAELVVADATTDHPAAPDARLRALDATLARTAGGQTTAIIARLAPDATVVGASVGDGEAWCARGDRWRELTADQHRKPLLGSGRAVPVVFTAASIDALFIASDGLVKYASSSEVQAILAADEPELPRQLADAARLPSGALHDDLAIVSVRRSRGRRSRVRRRS